MRVSDKNLITASYFCRNCRRVRSYRTFPRMRPSLPSCNHDILESLSNSFADLECSITPFSSVHENSPLTFFFWWLLTEYGLTIKAYRLLELRHVDHNGFCDTATNLQKMAEPPISPAFAMDLIFCMTANNQEHHPC